MDERLRRYGGLGIAALLVVIGTLATGLLPATQIYQLLAGGLIVAGFAVGYASLHGFELPE